MNILSLLWMTGTFQLEHQTPGVRTTHPCLTDDIQDPGRTSKMRPTRRQYGENMTEGQQSAASVAAGWCKMPHRAPGSSPPLVGFAVRKVIPGAGVW